MDLEPLDKWIISKAENLTKKVTDEFEKCQFNVAIEDVRNFTWHVLCDYYVEAVKDRLYNPDLHGSAKAGSSIRALRGSLPHASVAGTCDPACD